MSKRTGLSLVLALSMGCGAGNGAGGNESSTGGASAGGGGASAGGAPSTTQGGGGQGAGFAAGGNTGEGGGIICAPGTPDDDIDGDGYTEAQGDCEDCDPNRNPNALEVPTEDGKAPYDEDCDGDIDEPPDPPCDAGIDVDEMDPRKAAEAIEICKVSTGPDDWGFVSAEWVMADGSPPPVDPNMAQRFHLGHGFVDDFGPNVDLRAGERMLVLSSGTARRPNDPGYQSVGGFSKGYSRAFAQGFPKESPACPGVTTGAPNDPTGVELVLRAPSNATGFSFDFDFYTYEWPGFVCSTFNDFFLAILEPFPPGQTDGNISFDGDGNPISVNNALLEVCGCEGNPPNACMAGGKIFTCSLGNIELIGTGFGFDMSFGQDHGATSWLRTTAPVEGGSEVHLRFAVHDSGDGVLDSTTLVDNFEWIATPGTTVGTEPIPQ
ncbi:MAG: putative metal-binding motif-containing protein [Polyangiaceae bacterium]|nr:putative metal-binding motif-containing protein [Polyangiaceae bacterium]